MSGIGKKILTSAFRIALWAGMGAGLMAMSDRPTKEQQDLPSISQQEATKQYHENIKLLSIVFGGLEAQYLPGSSKPAKRV